MKAMFVVQITFFTSNPSQLWPFTSYNWLFLWAYTFYKWGFLSTYNWYNSGPVTANPFNPDVCWLVKSPFYVDLFARYDCNGRSFVFPLWGERPSAATKRSD